jgi:fimbrial isopeptide formation D2 family protein/LPXTG-motif cell wall-anchored protein
MKKHSRTLSLMLCVLLILSLFAAVHAAETDPGEKATYVLHYDVDGDGYDGPELQYFSPYRIQATMNGKEITMKNCIFSLYNTVNGEVIPVYCTDINVLAKSNYAYRRLNLEDSTFAAHASEQIRAIVSNGFYPQAVSGESDAQHALRVKEELKRLGDAAGVEDLTIGEAITGTQCAIWQAAHGSELVFKDFVLNMYTTDVSDSVRYYDICNEERINGHTKYKASTSENVNLNAENDKWIGSRIQAVYSYLLSLDPMPPTGTVVSGNSFQKIDDVRSFDNGDGTCDVVITATVKVRMESGDRLTVTASVGEHQTAAALSDGTQTVRLTLENVPLEQLEQKVQLTITGMQTGGDVYLYDAEGDRETSQSMVGKNDSQLPVYAAVSVTPNAANDDRILNIYKTTKVATGNDTYDRVPLEGITFDVYLVAELRDYLMGTVLLPEAGEYDYPETPDFTLVTDAEGWASINFTQKGMPDGVYLVVEREHPAIKAPVEPFYVIMPSTNPEGTGHIYEITVQPKNDVKGGVRIEKDVIELGNDSASVDAYSDHTWIIGTNIPDDLPLGKSFVISDTLDSRLDYVGNLRVTVESKDGETVAATLTEGVDYLLNVKDADSLGPGKPSDSFTVSLTQIGMAKAGSSGGDMLRVYFDARINANARMGIEIPNRATVNYTNSVNFDFSAESDRPEVYTGGATLRKVDAGNEETLLPGAVFEVYRYATPAEVAAGGDALTHIPGVSGAVLQMSFFDNEALQGDKVTSATSDDQGKVTVYGLAYGEYLLVETKAPDGYNLLDGAVTISIDGTTHTAEKAVTVKNVSGSHLPATGGIGTAVYYVTGISLLLAAVVFLATGKRKKYE